MFRDLITRRAEAAHPLVPDFDSGRSAQQRRRGSSSAVGVELAADAIRAAYVDGDRVEVGAVDLPEGTIVGGEILDPHAATDALRALWSQHRFPTKKVVVGIASPDIVTRPVVMPPMSAKDIRSALPFELADRVPFPIGDAVIDALAMGGSPTDQPGPTHDLATVDPSRAPGVGEIRLLAVLALQSTLRRVVSVAGRAGLSVLGVEPPPFALVRAAGRHDVLSHAVIDVGADTLVIAVHHCGVLQFYRSVLTRQSGSLSSNELEAELVFIEQFRRRAAGAEELTIDTATRDHPLVAAIRGTLEYANSQSGAISIDAVTLAGDHQRCEEVAAALGPALAVPLNVIDPVARAGASVASIGRGSAFATAMGLSLVPASPAQGPRRLDLLPRSDSAQTSPRRIALQAGVAALATGAVLAGATATVGPDPGPAGERLRQAQVTSAALDAQLHELAAPMAAVRETTALTRSLDKVTTLRTDWGRITQEIRLAAPSGVQLVSIDAKGPDPKRPGRGAGRIEVRAQAPNQVAITTWLDSLSRIEGVKNPWLDAASTGGERVGESSGFTAFTITMELSR